jgi:hypothetical protein
MSIDAPRDMPSREDRQRLSVARALRRSGRVLSNHRPAVRRGARWGVKTAFRQVLDKMVEVFAANLAEPEARERALALVALCVGAMVVARAVDDPKLGDGSRDAAREHVLAHTGWRDP